MIDLRRYMTSILGGPPRDHGPIAATQLVIGACMAGYTVTHLPPKFLALFEHPVAQYLVFFILFNTSHGDQTPKAWAFMDALILTLSVNALIFILQQLYVEKPKEEPKEVPKKEPAVEQVPDVKVGGPPDMNNSNVNHRHTHPHPHMH